MAKSKPVKINWKGLVHEQERRIEALSAGNEFLNKEIECANAQMKHLGTLFSEAGRERDDAFKVIGLAKSVIKGAAENLKKAGQTDLAAALYAQAAAL